MLFYIVNKILVLETTYVLVGCIRNETLQYTIKKICYTSHWHRLQSRNYFIIKEELLKRSLEHLKKYFLSEDKNMKIISRHNFNFVDSAV